MKRGELSFLVLIALIVYSSYVPGVPRTVNEALTAQSPSFAVRPSALLALAVKASDSSNKLCPQPSATEGYMPAQNKALWFPAKYSGYVESYSNGAYSAQNMLLTNLYGKPCSEMDNENKIFVISHCVGPEKCHADRYEDEDGTMHDIQGTPQPNVETPSKPNYCPEWYSCLIGSPAASAELDPALRGPVAPSDQIALPPSTGGSNPLSVFSDPPAVPSSGSGSNIGNNFRSDQISPASQSSAAPPSAGSLGKAPAAPSAPSASLALNYRTDNNNPSASLPSSQSYSPRPTYQSQTTFSGQGSHPPPNQNYSSQSPVDGFVSSIASLVGSLFSVPTNAVVTYIQTFVSPAQPTRTIPPPARPQNPAQVPVLPYPVPPAPTSDIYAQIRAIANEENDTPSASVAPATQDGTRALDVSLSDTAVQSEVTSSEKQDEQMIVKPKTRAEIEAAFMEDAKATTTESTPTPRLQRREPDVVEIGVAVDITDLTTYESILAYINGDWAHVQRTALQSKAALAQAESQQESIRAQIEVLQDARAAGICNEMCTAALSTLQRDLPRWESHVDALETAVRNDAAPQSAPPPTVGQISRVAQSIAEFTYEPSSSASPRSPSAPPAVISVDSPEILQPSSETTGESTVLRMVQSAWDFLKSWFSPSPQAQAPGGYTLALRLPLRQV